MCRFFLVWQCLLFGAGALAQEGRADAPGTRLTIAEILRRIDALDPSLREKAFERLRTEVELRRARWNRVQGSLRVRASETLGNQVILPSEEVQAGVSDWSDRLTVGILGEVALPLFTGGQITGQIENAENKLQSVQEQTRARALELKRAALVAYGRLILSGRQAEVAREALDRSVQLVAIAERRMRTGIGTEADVARTKLSVLSQKEDLERRRGEKELATAALKALLFIESDAAIQPAEDLDALSSLRGKESARERPELLALAWQLRASEAEVQVSRAAAWPRLELFLSGSYGNDNGLSSPFLADPREYSSHLGVFAGSVLGGVRLEWKVFDFFVVRDDIAAKEAAQNSIAARLESERWRLRREAMEANARLEEALRRKAALAEGREIANRVIQLARTRYETGNAILTEVITAEIEANQIQIRQNQADYDVAIAHIEQRIALGQEL